jgi:hypothetical protein
MWNSPNSSSKKGKRYTVEDITVLIDPLDQMLDHLEHLPVADVVEEPMLRRLEKGELVYALYQVLEALLDDVAILPKGHPGIHEAIVAELLHQTYTRICVELDEPAMGDFARRAAWQSIDRLLIQPMTGGDELPGLINDLGINVNGPPVHRSKELTTDVWEELLLSETYLWKEFLWDDDWRMEFLLDLPANVTKPVTETAGIDLETVHRLAHTPSEAEQRMADYYIRYVIWKDEARRVE